MKESVELACYRAYLAEKSGDQAEYEKQARIARALIDKKLREKTSL